MSNNKEASLPPCDQDSQCGATIWEQMGTVTTNSVCSAGRCVQRQTQKPSAGSSDTTIAVVVTVVFVAVVVAAGAFVAYRRWRKAKSGGVVLAVATSTA